MSADATTRPPDATPGRRAELIEASVPGAIPRAELDAWRDRFGLVAGVTGRGEADVPFALALRAPDVDAGTILERFREFRQAMRPAFTALQVAHQVHGAQVAWHAGVAPGFHVLDDADGHASAEAGLLLAVSVADCVPVYLAARDGSAFALLHAGWKGIAAGVLDAGLSALHRHAGVRPADVVAHCGVAICGDCYEVGPEVVRAIDGRVVRGRSRLDLRGALVRRAEAAGVHDVTVSPLCTSCDRDRFFSHRASGGASGRQLAYLGRPAA